MRAGMRTVAIAGGGASALLVVLLVAAVMAESWITAAAAGILGILLAVGVTVVVARFADRVSRDADRTSIRLRNIEARMSRDADKASMRATADAERDDRLENLRADLEGARKSIGVLDRRMKAAKLDALQAEVATLTRAVRVLRRRVPDGFLDPVHDELANLANTMATEIARLNGAVQETQSRADEPARAELAAVGKTAQDAWQLGTQTALRLGRHPRSFLTVTQAADLFERYLSEDRFLEVIPLITRYDLLRRLDLGTLRALYRFYKATGYLNHASMVLKRVAEASHRPGDRKAVAKLDRELALLAHPMSVNTDVPAAQAHDASGPILHFVGKVLPETQSGYTIRTHYTARAQLNRGLRVAVAGQSGITADRVEKATHYEYQGVDYHLLPGPVRGDIPIDEWLRVNVRELAALVRRLRPSVLHAHSDFYNALIVHAVGAAYGIPTAYETRGFWEESWLSRTMSKYSWELDSRNIFETYGLPAAYSLRKHAEEVARSAVHHNFTLAGVMREHILEASTPEGGTDDVSIVPNAVDPDSFPVQDRDQELADALGIPEDALVVGYVSSMVSYEGVDTLIDGYQIASERVSQRMWLLLVGDGSDLEALKQRVADREISNVIFTGSVPHDDILSYYGLIDIFVVPRKKSPVADLVTPLKPFEAFATGRAVILSDVAALQEIADQSGATETFRAGFPRDLARKIVELVGNPAKRRGLGVRAAHWVRAHRSWDANVEEYYRVYRKLGYRGPVDPSLESATERRSGGVRETLPRARPRESGPTAAPRGDSSSEDESRAAGDDQLVTTDQGAPEPGSSGFVAPTFRVVVVAMKPQIAGRIRRNIQTLLELGAQVVVVNTTPRDDFFQGLSSPRLSSDFVDVRSLAVRYQSRMTRKKNERQAKWDLQKKGHTGAAKSPVNRVPEWTSTDLPGMDLMVRGLTAPRAQEALREVRQRWRKADKELTKFVRSTRNKRELLIRDQLKQVHLVNRFAEFWRLAPARIVGHQPDLIISSDLPGLVGASIAAQRLGVPHLHDCHELYLESTTLKPYERRLLWPVEKHYIRRADSVVVVNETIRDEYARRYGVHGTVLRNSAPAVPESVRRNPMNLRALAGIAQDAKVLLYQGGFMTGRGLDVCVRAVEHLPPEVHLVAIGKGKMLEELQELARTLEVSDRVHWLPAVEPGELPAYTASADLGVIPYQPVSRNNQYALPNKIFEYTGAGIPFVASDLPELRRIVSTAACGAVYDPFSPDALASAVRRVLDPEQYATYRTNAEQFGRENSWETEREILVSEISRLVLGRASGVG
ncbi:glycosyltransferase [Brachybacterium sp. GCM10030268]|uniref:glycosyltransferase n=1 Tax=Brachybacterium sp. GCM10030268 TaxID=3273382 RepID=UPI003616B92D